MRFIKGTVAGVIEKGQGDKQYAVVGIKEIQKSRSGFDAEVITEIMVAGQQYKDGYHNTYRKLPPDKEIFVPVEFELNTFNGRSDIRARLNGVPVEYREVAATGQVVNPPKAVGSN